MSDGLTTGRVEEPTGTLAVALERAERLLGVDPALAEEQAREILKVIPGQREAELLVAVALRRKGRAADARVILERLIAAAPNWAKAHYELGLVMARLGRSKKAINELQRAVAIQPDLTNAWRSLGDQLTLEGDAEGADHAYAKHIESSTKDPELLEAAAALVDNRIAVAERRLRAFLMKHPTDVAAIRMLAEVAARIGRYEDAENLLTRCLELAPSFAAARHNFAIVLLRRNKPEESLKEITKLLRTDPQNPSYRTLYSAALVRVGGYHEAIENYEKLLKEYPNQPKSWMSFGHALKTVGRTEECIEVYRKSIRMLPSLGEAYWSLANLKTFRFEDAEIDAMRRQLERSDLEYHDRLHFHFALGKALEDKGLYEESFQNYAKGNELAQTRSNYDPDEVALRLDRPKAVFTAALFDSRKGQGSPAPDPIFVLGMPRAGSTLVEQILSSHSLVEGTMELPDIMALANRLAGKVKASDESKYPEIVAELSPDQLRALGDEYIARTRIQRKTGKPYFVDKMPNNFAHIGLIHLILPNAKIIDVRRHPLACCFSGFKQHFAHGQNFSYGLARIGRYYRDYVMLMKHYDAVLPGVVHRVIYENLVRDTEAVVRGMLDYCGLDFEPACLSFYETKRAVRTASSEQVRQPIYSEGLEQWRHYEPWLGELTEALGDVVDAYPNAP